MNKLIKEALKNYNHKDRETERICQVIADFIKEYGYILCKDDVLYMKLYVEPTDSFYSKFRVKFTSTINSKISSETITTSYDFHTIKHIITKEGGVVEKLHSGSWVVGFPALN